MVWLPIPFSACVHINPWTAVQTMPYADVVAVSALRGAQGAHSKRGAAHRRGQVVPDFNSGRSHRPRYPWIRVAHTDSATRSSCSSKMRGVMARKSLRAGLCLPNASSLPSRAPPHATPGIVRSSGLRAEYHHLRAAPVMLHARAASGNHVVHE